MIDSIDIFMKNAKKVLTSMISRLYYLDSIKISSLDPHKTMLIIIDMNNGFAKQGALFSSRIKELIPNVVKLTKNCIEKGIITIAYTDTHTEDSPELKSFPEHCMKGSKEAEVIDELLVFKDKGLRVYEKNSTNGMMAVNPMEALTARYSIERINKIDTFVIIGCETDICVYQYATTLKAYLNQNNINSRVIVPMNCVDTFNIPDVHDAEFMNIVFFNSMLDNGLEVVKSIELRG
ncbi:cysteine hydrolase [Clostridiaceae bacterium M8S5]|nr:cysteine hydrolase [Clostridiaceae bacterium M8S5]